MAEGFVGNFGHRLKSQLLVEPGSLEVMRRKVDVCAPARLRFPPCRGDQRLAEALAAMRLVDPDLTQLANSTPRVACDRTDQSTVHFGNEAEGRCVMVTRS